MPLPLVPIALGAGGLGLLYLLTRPKEQTAAPLPVKREPPENSKPEIVPKPIPPVEPVPIPSNLATAVVSASSLRVRDQPDERTGKVVIALPRGATVGILDTTTTAPTPAAPLGWFHVQTNTGQQGWASAEFLEFGSAKERGMTPEEELEYHKREAEREAPIISGMAYGAHPFAGIGACGPRFAGVGMGIPPAAYPFAGIGMGIPPAAYSFAGIAGCAGCSSFSGLRGGPAVPMRRPMMGPAVGAWPRRVLVRAR